MVGKPCLSFAEQELRDLLRGLTAPKQEQAETSRSLDLSTCLSTNKDSFQCDNVPVNYRYSLYLGVVVCMTI
jgi:hypothetical protein